jgi:hypothetical protein
MIIGPGDNDKALRTNKIFIPEQMVSTTIAEAGKQKTNEIVPQIIDVTHAAMLNYFHKVKKLCDTLGLSVLATKNK